MNSKTQKKKIIDQLGKEEKSTSEISVLSKVNYYQTRELLKELEEQDRVKKDKKSKGTYWKLKGK